MKDEKKKQAASEEVKAEAKADSAKASDAGKTADEAGMRQNLSKSWQKPQKR